MAYQPYQPWAASPPCSKQERKNSMASLSYSPVGQSVDTTAFNLSASNSGVSSSMCKCSAEDEINSRRSDFIMWIIWMYSRYKIYGALLGHSFSNAAVPKITIWMIEIMPNGAADRACPAHRWGNGFSRRNQDANKSLLLVHFAR